MKNLITDGDDNLLSTNSFTVTGRGTEPTARPYQMKVEVSPHDITIGGIRLSWNDALVAFDSLDARNRAFSYLETKRKPRKGK